MLLDSTTIDFYY